MKINSKKFIKNNKIKLQSSIEDLKYLQKKISGKSVYKKIGSLYSRRPKHRKAWQE